MVSLAARPDLGDRAARWFSAHWGVPEAEYRASIQASLAQGLARALLDLARREAGAAGIPRLYLVTDHTAFYEKCGWTYLTQARDTETGEPIRVYTAATEGAR